MSFEHQKSMQSFGVTERIKKKCQTLWFFPLGKACSFPRIWFSWGEKKIVNFFAKSFLKSDLKWFCVNEMCGGACKWQGFCGWFALGVGTVVPGAGSSPHYEVGVSPLHDLLLRADVLLLSCIHNVAFLENLHCEGFGFFTFQLDLKERQKEVRKWL